MTRTLTSWIMTAFVALAFGACSESDGGDTQTNWLVPCTTDADCGELSCLCQRCTLPCTGESDCLGAPAGTSCQAAGDPALGQICGSVEEPGLCMPDAGSQDEGSGGSTATADAGAAGVATSSGSGGSSQGSGGAIGSAGSSEAGATASGGNAGASAGGSAGSPAGGNAGSSSGGTPDAGASGQPDGGSVTGADLGGTTTNLPNDGLGAPDELACDEETGVWAPMSTTGAPPGALAPMLFFTGQELAVLTNPVAFYDRCADSWRTGPQAPGFYSASTAVEAAGQLFFFRMLDTTPEMLSFDYVSETFSEVSVMGMPAADFSARLAVGAGLLAWGGGVPRGNSNGYDGTSAGGLLEDGFWNSVAADGAPSPRVAPAAWTGSEVAIWGGRTGDSLQSDAGRMDCPAYDYPDCTVYADGALYDPALETWRPMSNDGAPAPRHSHILAWTGDRVLVWGGRANAADADPPERTWLLDGALYDPAADEWTPTADAPEITISLEATTRLWTGDRVALLQNGLWSGFLYDPVSNAWSELAAPADGEACFSTPLVQAGALVVGCSVADVPSTIAVLPPGANAWQTHASPEGAPLSPGILWTGRHLFLWGGEVPMPDPCQNVPPMTGCDPPSPVYTNTGWVLAP